MLEHFFKSLVATVSDPYQCNRITDALAAAGIKFRGMSQRCLWTKKMLIWLCTLYIPCHKPGVPLRTKHSDI